MKAPKGSLVLAGLAAFAYYKYSKMSKQEKDSLVGDLKTKGQKLYDEYAPEEVKSLFNKKQQGSNQPTEGQSYTG
jgi:hypothetical protein